MNPIGPRVFLGYADAGIWETAGRGAVSATAVVVVDDDEFFLEEGESGDMKDWRVGDLKFEPKLKRVSSEEEEEVLLDGIRRRDDGGGCDCDGASLKGSLRLLLPLTPPPPPPPA